MPKGTPNIGAAVAQETENPKSLLSPPEGGKRLSKDQLFDYLATLDPDKDWPHCNVYVWRRWPVIDHSLLTPGAKNYIQLITAADQGITEEEFVWRHGSGEYKIAVNDLNKSGNRMSICESVFSIKDPEHPPVYDKATLVLGHPNNRSEEERLRARGELPAEGKVQTGTDSAGVAAMANALQAAMKMVADNKKPDLEGNVLTNIISMFQTANSESLKMAVSQAKQSDPENFLKMIGALKELAPQQDNALDLVVKIMALVKPPDKPAEDPMMAYVLKDLSEERKTNRDLLMKMLEKKSGGDEDEPKGFMRPLVEKLIERSLDTLDNTGGSGGQLKWWQEMAPVLTHEIQLSLGHIASLFRGAPPRPNPGGAPAAPYAAPETQPGLPAAEENPMMQMLAQIAPTLIGHLRDTSLSGEDFAEWFVYGVPGHGGGYGLLFFQQQIQPIGKETIISMAKQFPPLWNQIAPAGEERINEFLDEFLGWQPDNEPPEDPPAPAKKKRKEATQ